MVQSIYTIHDVVAAESGALFTAKNDDLAIRNTVNLLIQSNISSPTDYVLLYIGIFNNETSEITPIEQKVIDFMQEYETILKMRAHFTNNKELYKK